MVLEGIYETKGVAIAITDNELLEEQKTLASLEGEFVCPEGASAFKERKLRQQGFIKKTDTVVVLKYRNRN